MADKKLVRQILGEPVKSKKEELFDITEKEIINGMCDHKRLVKGKLGADLKTNQDSTEVKCNICGRKFNVSPKTAIEVNDDFESVIEDIEMIMLSAKDLPEETLRVLSEFKAIARRMPNVYKIQCIEKKAYNDSFTNNNNHRENTNGPKQLFTLANVGGFGGNNLGFGLNFDAFDSKKKKKKKKKKK